MKFISVVTVLVLFGIVSCQGSGSNIASDIIKGTTLCMKRFVATTGHEFSTIGISGYKPPCDIYEAYMACALENVENVLGTDMTPGVVKSIQQSTNQQMQLINCHLNITALVEKIHDGTAPTLGPPGDSNIPAIDAWATCMDTYTKSLQNIENTTEICPKMRDFALCYFRSSGLKVNAMSDAQVQTVQYQWDDQMAQVEHQTHTKIDCHIDIKQLFTEIGNGANNTLFGMGNLIACFIAFFVLSRQ